MAHTPGPWAVESWCSFDGQQQYAIKALSGEALADVMVYGPNAEANARLIAAAPDLLEACELSLLLLTAPKTCLPPCRCDPEVEFICLGCATMAALQTAIAKARGE